MQQQFAARPDPSAPEVFEQLLRCIAAAASRGASASAFVSLLHAGQTCWRIKQADRVSLLIDNAAFFSAAKSAMRAARRSIHLLGWEFDPRTALEPGKLDAAQPDAIGPLLIALANERPSLDVRVLIWRAPLWLAAGEQGMPYCARSWLKDTSVRFALDDTVPLGASHHQKALIIDDAVAFYLVGFHPMKGDSEHQMELKGTFDRPVQDIPGVVDKQAVAGEPAANAAK